MQLMEALIYACVFLTILIDNVKCGRANLELGIIFDHSSAQLMENYYLNAEEYAEDIVKDLNTILKAKDQVKLSVTLNWLEVWTMKDLIDISFNDGYVTDWNTYIPKRKSDAVIFITAVDFNVAGRFGLNGVCSKDFHAGFAKFSSNSNFLATIIMHELGHGLGCVHDKPNDEGIMDPAPSWSKKRWSSKSKKQVKKFIKSSRGSCLHEEIKEEPVCGDGKIDSGEECDCGPKQCECCDTNCKFIEKQSRCNSDIDGMYCKKCSGRSTGCDLQVNDFESCFNGIGQCYAGSCVDHDIQCNSVFRPKEGYEAVAAYDDEYEKNSDTSASKLFYNGGGFYVSRAKYELPKTNSGDEQCGQLLCDIRKNGRSQFKWTALVKTRCFSKGLPQHDWCVKKTLNGGITYLQYSREGGANVYRSKLVDEGTRCTKNGRRGYCVHEEHSSKGMQYFTGSCKV